VRLVIRKRNRKKEKGGKEICQASRFSPMISKERPAGTRGKGGGKRKTKRKRKRTRSHGDLSSYRKRKGVFSTLLSREGERKKRGREGRPDPANHHLLGLKATHPIERKGRRKEKRKKDRGREACLHASSLLWTRRRSKKRGRKKGDTDRMPVPGPPSPLCEKKNTHRMEGGGERRKGGGKWKK